MTTQTKIFNRIGGHRGFGCTDQPGSRDHARHNPPENTLESIRLAFEKGADFIELDVISTADGEIVVMHADQISQHVLGQPDTAYISQMSLPEVQQLKVGLHGKTGPIPTLKEVLDYIATLPPQPSPKDFRINIELKGAQGTGRSYDEKVAQAFIKSVKEVVDGTQLPLSKAVFSSFALADLIYLQQISPRARLAQLFEVPTYPEGPMYAKMDTAPEISYLHFTLANFQRVHNALPNLEFVHPGIPCDQPEEFLKPELMESLRIAYAKGIKTNIWTWQEKPPSANSSLIQTLRDVVEQTGHPIGIITDFPNQMRNVAELKL